MSVKQKVDELRKVILEEYGLDAHVDIQFHRFVGGHINRNSQLNKRTSSSVMGALAKDFGAEVTEHNSLGVSSEYHEWHRVDTDGVNISSHYVLTEGEESA